MNTLFQRRYVLVVAACILVGVTAVAAATTARDHSSAQSSEILTSATADSIDPVAVMRDMLASKGAVRKRRKTPIYQRRCSENCFGGREGPGVCREVNCRQVRVGTQEESVLAPLLPTDVQLARVNELEFGEPFPKSVPDRLYRQVAVLRNCTSVPQNQTITLTQQLMEQRGLQVTRAVTAGRTVSVNAGVKFSVVSVGASVQFSQSVTVTNASSSSTSNTLARTISQTVTAAPGKEIVAELRVLEALVTIPFSVALVFDGNVDDNEEGIKKLDQVLSEDERTIRALGLMTFTAASNGEVVMHENDANCSSGEGASLLRFGPSDTTESVGPVQIMYKRP